MTCQLYTVTLTDLVTYAVTVAGDNAAHAQDVAKTLLFEEPPGLPDGIAIAKRETEANAVVAESQPVRRFDVFATYSIEFSIRVPAATSEEAERHARRIYADDPMPFEHTMGEDRVRWTYAKEVVS